jgi:hypothetical protein
MRARQLIRKLLDAFLTRRDGSNTATHSSKTMNSCFHWSLMAGVSKYRHGDFLSSPERDEECALSVRWDDHYLRDTLGYNLLEVSVPIFEQSPFRCQVQESILTNLYTQVKNRHLKISYLR